MGTSSPSRFARLKRLQFSLRTMLVVMAMMSIVFVLWVLPSERQRRAVQEIERLGGFWKFRGEKIDKGWLVSNTNKPNETSRWLHYFKNVDGVNLAHSSAATIDWNALPHLRTINLLWVKISESDATKIGQLKELQSITLQGCEMNDEAIYTMTRSPTLREFEIYGETPIFPEDSLLKYSNLGYEKNSVHGRSLLKLNKKHPHWLSDLKKLEYLGIRLCKVDSSIFDQVTQLENLTKLNFSSTGLNDVNTSGLFQLKNVEELNLEFAYFEPPTMENIARLPKLKKLNLFHRHVFENELEPLTKSTTLEHLECTFIPNPEFVQTVVNIPNLKFLRFEVATNQPQEVRHNKKTYVDLIDKITKARPALEMKTPYDSQLPKRKVTR